MSTLLLSCGYEPIRILPTKRAVVLVLQDKAEVVEEHPFEWFRSATFTMNCPAVIRLKYSVNIPYRARLPLTRQAVLTRDNWECQFVGCTRKGTTIDHVKPRSKGGKHEWENVVAACSKCNAKKADIPLDKLGWKLKNIPYAPHGSKWLLIGIKADPLWKPYLTGFSE